MALAGAYLFSNVVGAYAAESAFWKERRNAAQRMQQKSSLSESLPALGLAAEERARAGLTSEQYQMLAQLPRAGQVNFGAVADIPITNGWPGQGVGEKIPAGLKGGQSGDDSPAWLSTLILPYGTLRDVYLSPAQSAPLVIHIQDAHDIQEAQKNMAAMIQGLREGRGITLVGLEGAAGAFALEPYRSYPNAAVTRGIAEYFLKEGYIGGPEFVGLTAPEPPTLWGVEDLSLYQGNIQAFKDSVRFRPDLQAFLKRLKTAADRLKFRVYSNPLKDFDRHFNAYKSRQEGLGDYVRFLMDARQNPRGYPNLYLLLDALEWEESLDFRRVEKERLQLVEVLARELSEAQLNHLVQQSLLYRLGRMGYGDYHRFLRQLCRDNGIRLEDFGQLDSYITYVLLAERINRNELLVELTRLEDDTQFALAITPEQKRMVLVNRNLMLLEKLASHAMTPVDWHYYDAKRPEVLRIAQDLEQMGQALGDPPALDTPRNFPAMLEPFEQFCQRALERNRALVDNLLAKLKEKAGPSSPSVAVLVAGGFHTEGLSQLLRSKEISYVVVTPKISEVPKESKYLDVFAHDPLPLEKLFAGETIYLAAERLLVQDGAQIKFSHARLNVFRGLYQMHQAALQTVFTDAEEDLEGLEGVLNRQAAAFAGPLTQESLRVEIDDEISRRGFYSVLRYSLTAENGDPIRAQLAVMPKDKLEATKQFLEEEGMRDAVHEAELTVDGETYVLVLFKSTSLADTLAGHWDKLRDWLALMKEGAVAEGKQPSADESAPVSETWRTKVGNSMKGALGRLRDGVRSTVAVDNLLVVLWAGGLFFAATTLAFNAPFTEQFMAYLNDAGMAGRFMEFFTLLKFALPAFLTIGLAAVLVRRDMARRTEGATVPEAEGRGPGRVARLLASPAFLLLVSGGLLVLNIFLRAGILAYVDFMGSFDGTPTVEMLSQYSGQERLFMEFFFLKQGSPLLQAIWEPLKAASFFFLNDLLSLTFVVSGLLTAVKKLFSPDLYARLFRNKTLLMSILFTLYTMVSWEIGMDSGDTTVFLLSFVGMALWHALAGRVAARAASAASDRDRMGIKLSVPRLVSTGLGILTVFAFLSTVYTMASLGGIPMLGVVLPQAGGWAVHPEEVGTFSQFLSDNPALIVLPILYALSRLVAGRMGGAEAAEKKEGEAGTFLGLFLMVLMPASVGLMSAAPTFSAGLLLPGVLVAGLVLAALAAASLTRKLAPGSVALRSAVVAAGLFAAQYFSFPVLINAIQDLWSRVFIIQFHITGGPFAAAADAGTALVGPVGAAGWFVSVVGVFLVTFFSVHAVMKRLFSGRAKETGPVAEPPDAPGSWFGEDYERFVLDPALRAFFDLHREVWNDMVDSLAGLGLDGETTEALRATRDMDRAVNLLLPHMGLYELTRYVFGAVSESVHAGADDREFGGDISEALSVLEKETGVRINPEDVQIVRGPPVGARADRLLGFTEDRTGRLKIFISPEVLREFRDGDEAREIARQQNISLEEAFQVVLVRAFLHEVLEAGGVSHENVQRAGFRTDGLSSLGETARMFALLQRTELSPLLREGDVGIDVRLSDTEVESALALRRALELAIFNRRLGPPADETDRLTREILATHVELSYLETFPPALRQEVPDQVGLLNEIQTLRAQGASDVQVAQRIAQELGFGDDTVAIQRAAAVLSVALPTEVLHTRGGDGRSAIDPRTGKTNYGNAAKPTPGVKVYSSSTSSPPTAEAFARMEEVRQDLLEQMLMSPRGFGRYFEKRMENVRQRVLRALGLEEMEGVTAVTTPSATDVELIPLMIAANRGKPVRNLVLTETGSGTKFAAGGLYIDDQAPDGSVIKGRKGKPIPGFPAQTTEVTEMSADASALDRQVEEYVRANIGESTVIVHLVADSKTGLTAPQFQTIAKLSKEYGDDLMVVVDAAQGRIEPRFLQDYLDRGWIVFSSGSKFWGGVPFSGIAAIPKRLRAEFHGLKDVPKGLGEFLTSSDLPADVPWRDSAGGWRNTSLLLRWEAALFEMEAFLHGQGEHDEITREIVLRGVIQRWMDGVRELMDRKKARTGRQDAVEYKMTGRGSTNTIVSFKVKDRQGNNLTPAQLKKLHAWLHQDVSALLPKGAADWERDVAARKYLLGQPVDLTPQEKDESMKNGVLRITLGAPLARQLADQAGPDLDQDRIEKALEQEMEDVRVLLLKIQLIVRRWDAVERAEKGGVLGMVGGLGEVANKLADRTGRPLRDIVRLFAHGEEQAMGLVFVGLTTIGLGALFSLAGIDPSLPLLALLSGVPTVLRPFLFRLLHGGDLYFLETTEAGQELVRGPPTERQRQQLWRASERFTRSFFIGLVVLSAVFFLFDLFLQSYGISIHAHVWFLLAAGLAGIRAGRQHARYNLSTEGPLAMPTTVSPSSDLWPPDMTPDMPAAGFIRALFEGAPIRDVRNLSTFPDGSPLNGASLKRVWIEPSGRMPASGLETLYYQLGIDNRNGTSHLPESLDLLYDDMGRLVAIFPVFLDSESPSIPVVDLTHYYYDARLLRGLEGLDPDAFRERVAEINQSWTDFGKSTSRAFMAIRGYVEAKKWSDLVFDAARNALTHAEHVYARINIADADRDMDIVPDISPLGSRLRYSENSLQLLFPVFPTVYSPEKYSNQSNDDGFYRALLGKAKHRFDINPDAGSKTLIVGTGSGMDALIAALQTKGEIWVTDINPFALASVRHLFHLAGLEHRLRTFVMDNVSDEDGNPRLLGEDGRPVQFDRVVWNMPIHSARSMNNKDMRRARGLWDGVGPEVLRRFAGVLPQILRTDGMALVWNHDVLDNVGNNEVEMAFRTAGEYLDVPPEAREGRGPFLRDTLTFSMSVERISQSELGSNGKFPPYVIKHAATAPAEEPDMVREAMFLNYARKAGLGAEDYERLLGMGREDVNLILAERSDSPEWVLRRLAGIGGKRLMSMLCKHPALPTDVLLDMALRGEPFVRTMTMSSPAATVASLLVVHALGSQPGFKEAKDVIPDEKRYGVLGDLLLRLSGPLAQALSALPDAQKSWDNIPSSVKAELEELLRLEPVFRSAARLPADRWKNFGSSGNLSQDLARLPAFVEVSGGGQHPLGQDDFSDREKRELLENVGRSEARFLTDDQMLRAGLASEVRDLLMAEPGSPPGRVLSLPRMRESVEALMNYLRQGPGASVTVGDRTYGVQIHFTRDAAPFRTAAGREAGAFTVVEGDVIHIYARDLPGFLHEGLEFLAFPRDAAIPNDRRQRHTLAFFAEALVRGAPVRGDVAVPGRAFREVDRMTDETVLRGFVQGYEDALAQLREKFSGQPEYLQYGLSLAEAMHSRARRNAEDLAESQEIFDRFMDNLRGIQPGQPAYEEAQKLLRFQETLTPEMAVISVAISAARHLHGDIQNVKLKDIMGNIRNWLEVFDGELNRASMISARSAVGFRMRKDIREVLVTDGAATMALHYLREQWRSGEIDRDVLDSLFAHTWQDWFQSRTDDRDLRARFGRILREVKFSVSLRRTMARVLYPRHGRIVRTTPLDDGALRGRRRLFVSRKDLLSLQSALRMLNALVDMLDPGKIRAGDRFVVYELPGAGTDGLGIKQQNDVFGYELANNLIQMRREKLKALMQEEFGGRVTLVMPIYDNFKENTFDLRMEVTGSLSSVQMREGLDRVRQRLRAEMTEEMRRGRFREALVAKRDLLMSYGITDIDAQNLFEVRFGFADVAEGTDEERLAADIQAHQAMNFEGQEYSREAYEGLIGNLTLLSGELEREAPGIFRPVQDPELGEQLVLRDEVVTHLRKQHAWEDLPAADRALFRDDPRAYRLAGEFFRRLKIQDYIKKWNLDFAAAADEAAVVREGVQSLSLFADIYRDRELLPDKAVKPLRGIFRKTQRYLWGDPKNRRATSVHGFHSAAPFMPRPVYINIDVRNMGGMNITQFQLEVKRIKRALDKGDWEEVSRIQRSAADEVTRNFLRMQQIVAEEYQRVREAHQAAGKPSDELVDGSRMVLADGRMLKGKELAEYLKTHPGAGQPLVSLVGGDEYTAVVDGRLLKGRALYEFLFRMRDRIREEAHIDIRLSVSALAPFFRYKHFRRGHLADHLAHAEVILRADEQTDVLKKAEKLRQQGHSVPDMIVVDGLDESGEEPIRFGIVQGRKGQPVRYDLAPVLQEAAIRPRQAMAAFAAATLPAGLLLALSAVLQLLTGQALDVAALMPILLAPVFLMALVWLASALGWAAKALGIRAGPVDASRLVPFLQAAQDDPSVAFFEVQNGVLKANPAVKSWLSHRSKFTQNLILYGLGVVGHEASHLQGHGELYAYGLTQILPAFLGAALGGAVAAFLGLSGGVGLLVIVMGAMGIVGLVSALLARASRAGQRAYDSRHWRRALVSFPEVTAAEDALDLILDDFTAMAFSGKLPFATERNKNTVRQALSALDESRRAVLLKRLHYLDTEDIHGLRRWFKDAAWLVGQKRLRQQAPDWINTEELVDVLREAGLTGSRLAEAAAQLRQNEEAVVRRLGEGKAILIYDREVRFHPLRRRFVIREPRTLEAYRSQPLTIQAPPRIVISALIYNGWDDTRGLLESLGNINTPNVDLVLLDNNSRESRLGEFAGLNPSSYELTLFRSPENLGFDEGHNAVMDYALDELLADHVLLLNNDVIVDADFISGLLTQVEREPGEKPVGIVGPMVYEMEDGRPTDVIANYGSHDYRDKLTRPVTIAKGERGGEQYPESMSVGVVYGMAMLIPQAALRTVGLWDPRYFAYGEEIDLAYRMKEAGFDLRVTRLSKIWHAHSRSSGEAYSPFALRQSVRNAWLSLRKHRVLWHPKSFIRLQLSIAASFFRAVRKTIQRKQLRYIKAAFEGLYLGLRSRFYEAQTDYLENWTQGPENARVERFTPASPAGVSRKTTDGLSMAHAAATAVSSAQARRDGYRDILKKILIGVDQIRPWTPYVDRGWVHRVKVEPVEASNQERDGLRQAFRDFTAIHQKTLEAERPAVVSAEVSYEPLSAVVSGGTLDGQALVNLATDAMLQGTDIRDVIAHRLAERVSQRLEDRDLTAADLEGLAALLALLHGVGGSVTQSWETSDREQGLTPAQRAEYQRLDWEWFAQLPILAGHDNFAEIEQAYNAARRRVLASGLDSAFHALDEALAVDGPVAVEVSERLLGENLSPREESTLHLLKGLFIRLSEDPELLARKQVVLVADGWKRGDMLAALAERAGLGPEVAARLREAAGIRTLDARAEGAMAGGRISAQAVMRLLRTGKGQGMDIFAMDQEHWDTTGVEHLVNLLLVLSGDLVKNAASGIGEAIEKMEFIKIQA